MRNLLLLTTVSLLLLGAARGWESAEPTLQLPAPHPAPARAEVSCKPSGPLRVEFASGERRADGSYLLSFSIQPVLGMRAVAWRIEHHEDVLPLEGLLAGDARTERGVTTTGSIRMLVPAHLGRTSIDLVVSGIFLGSDSQGGRFDERVEVVRSITWGEHAPIGRVTTQRDSTTGEMESMVLIPAFQAQIPGNGSRRAGR